MAEENLSWGYTRIMGALLDLGHEVNRGTIANVLLEHGIIPAPERGKKGLITYYMLFLIELSTRRVEIAGITPNPPSGPSEPV